MPGIHIGNTNLNARFSRARYPAVIDDGNTKIFFDYTIGITKDVSNFVSAWNSRIGANHLLQTTGTKQPLWSANGILFDGIDNFMKCVAFEWNQPEFIYMVMRQVIWTEGKFIFDGEGINYGRLGQITATPNIQGSAGTAGGDNTNLEVNTWGIVRVLFNEASSKIIVNTTAPTTWNCGVNNMGGFILGARGLGGGSWSNIEAKEIIGRSSVLGEADILAYYQTKYAAILP